MDKNREATISEREFREMAALVMDDVIDGIKEGSIQLETAVPIALAKIRGKIFPKEEKHGN